MSELVDVDADGHQQFIWLQERKDTCGPACVYMIERITAQACTVGGETRIRQISELLPDGYKEGNGTASYTALAAALKRIGIPASTSYISNFKEFTSTSTFPFIARIGWPNGAGHFVVCVDRSRHNALVCLDPWYGLSEPSLESLPAYRVTRNTRSAVCLANPIGGMFSGHVIALH